MGSGTGESRDPDGRRRREGNGQRDGRRDGRADRKGVFSIEEVRNMLDRLEVAVTRVEGEIEGDLPQEAEVAATMAIVDHLRDILISRGRPG